jgi:hypothetical protein
MSTFFLQQTPLDSADQDRSWMVSRRCAQRDCWCPLRRCGDCHGRSLDSKTATLRSFLANLQLSETFLFTSRAPHLEKTGRTWLFLFFH